MKGEEAAEWIKAGMWLVGLAIIVFLGYKFIKAVGSVVKPENLKDVRQNIEEFRRIWR